MANVYSEEEKQNHLDQYKESGKTKTEYAREHSIPEATFRAWVKEEMLATYGMLDFNSSETNVTNNKIPRSKIFVDEYIRIELRYGYDKQFLKRIVEVLTSDSEFVKGNI